MLAFAIADDGLETSQKSICSTHESPPHYGNIFQIHTTCGTKDTQHTSQTYRSLSQFLFKNSIEYQETQRQHQPSTDSMLQQFRSTFLAQQAKTPYHCRKY